MLHCRYHCHQAQNAGRMYADADTVMVNSLNADVSKIDIN